MSKHKNQFFFLPSTEITAGLVASYWNDLATNPAMFKARFNEHEDPTVDDAIAVALNPTTTTWFAFIYPATTPLNPVGEFTVAPLNRAAAFMHFSANPVAKLNLAEKFEVSIAFHRLFFSASDQTLIGVTPVQNKAAIATATRFGYKIIATVPKIAYNNAEITDAVLTILTKDHFNSIYNPED